MTRWASVAVCAFIVSGCGDSTGSGGTSQGGSGQGGTQGNGGSSQGGSSNGGAEQGGSAASGGSGQGGSGAYIPSGSGSSADVDCPSFCASAVALNCQNGPTQEQCEAVCTSLKADCPTFDTFVDCAGTDPEFECSGSGFESVECKDEFTNCVQPCAMQGG